jgi:membrane-associated PAP2 superfamily phosphatase
MEVMMRASVVVVGRMEVMMRASVVVAREMNCDGVECKWSMIMTGGEKRNFDFVEKM